MKHARVFHAGSVHHAVASGGLLRLDDGRIVHPDQVGWLPPLAEVPRPRTVFALGLNYADHARELSFKPPEKPLVFLKSPSSLVGHGAFTRRPADATYMHYECELAVVIGRAVRNATPGNAGDCIAGYTMANDYAIRDYLENYYRPNLRVKSRDACTPIGPFLVDAQDIPDPMALELRTTVNGVLTQKGNTRDMVFSIPELIVHLSSFMTLHPGDVILTGTPLGLADVKAGDVVVTSIEGIGDLKNTIRNDHDYFFPHQHRHADGE